MIFFILRRATGDLWHWGAGRWSWDVVEVQGALVAMGAAQPAAVD